MAYGIVNGEVANIFYNGYGVGVVEKFTKRDGTEGQSRYTAWFDTDGPKPDLQQGQTGKFSGTLSARVREYEHNGETRHSADVSLNNAKFEPEEGGGSAPADDDSAPF